MNEIYDEFIVDEKRTAGRVRSIAADDLSPFDKKKKGRQNDIFLQELSIQGLLSFKERSQFTFGRLNILVGPNGSGKSNLIDCIRVLRNSPYDIQESFRDTGFEDWLFRGEDKLPALIEVVAFIPELANEIRHNFRLSLGRSSQAQLEEVISDATDDTKTYFSGSYRSEPIISISGKTRNRDRILAENEYTSYQSILSQIRDAGQYPEVTLLSNHYASFRVYSEWSFGRNSRLRESALASNSGAVLSESMENLALVLNGLEQTRAHEEIRLLLKDLKETYVDYITKIIFGRVGLELVESPFDLPLPAKRLSDGTLRFLALAAILLQPAPPRLICIEEPELGMHPDMIRMVAKMIVDASRQTQIIISTHSEYLLSALQDDFDALFAFDASMNGSSVRPFTNLEFKDWADEHTLGELWTSGELGGNRW